MWTLQRRPAHFRMLPNIRLDVDVAPIQAGSTWQLALKKGHRLVNRTGQSLQMLQRYPLGLQTCAAGPTADMFIIEPGEVSSPSASDADISRQSTPHTCREQLHCKQWRTFVRLAAG